MFPARRPYASITFRFLRAGGGQETFPPGRNPSAEEVARSRSRLLLRTALRARLASLGCRGVNMAPTHPPAGEYARDICDGVPSRTQRRSLLRGNPAGSGLGVTLSSPTTCCMFQAETLIPAPVLVMWFRGRLPVETAFLVRFDPEVTL